MGGRRRSSRAGGRSPTLVADSATSADAARQARSSCSRRARSPRTRSGSTRSRASRHTRQLDRDTLVLVLSGAYRDRLEGVHVVVSRSSAACRTRATSISPRRKAAATRARRRRASTSISRPSPAFSTLGWFNDPLLSTSLRADSLDLANTVIHELTHNTFYAPGQAVFNEIVRELRRRARRGVVLPVARTAGRGGRGGRALGRREGARRGSGRRSIARVDSAFKAHPGDERAGRGAHRGARLDVRRARETLLRRARAAAADDQRPRAVRARPAGQRGADGAPHLPHRSRCVRRRARRARAATCAGRSATIIEVAKANRRAAVRRGEGARGGAGAMIHRGARVRGYRWALRVYGSTRIATVSPRISGRATYQARSGKRSASSALRTPKSRA